jgi:hypothetical protein
LAHVCFTTIEFQSSRLVTASKDDLETPVKSPVENPQHPDELYVALRNIAKEPPMTDTSLSKRLPPLSYTRHRGFGETVAADKTWLTEQRKCGKWGAFGQCGDPSPNASRPTPRRVRTNQVHHPADPGQSA